MASKVHTRSSRAFTAAAVLLLSLACGSALRPAQAQGGAATASAPSAATADADAPAAVRTQVTALRDSFVAATAAAGLPCAVAPPAIVIEGTPSFGNYDPDTNRLTVSAWEQLSPNEKAIFYKFAGPDATEAAARRGFDSGVHHWVAVHELGHWWQACRKVADRGNHYAIEYEANRIAGAYWREHDPSIIAYERPAFEGIIANWPNPVPPGQVAEPYFDANYEELGRTPAYLWFQSRMCLAAYDEKPLPTFVQTLRQTGNTPKATP